MEKIQKQLVYLVNQKLLCRLKVGEKQNKQQPKRRKEGTKLFNTSTKLTNIYSLHKYILRLRYKLDSAALLSTLSVFSLERQPNKLHRKAEEDEKEEENKPDAEETE